MSKERNIYIDCCRGYAALGVIVAHTAFLGVQETTPAWFMNMLLIFDVPVFFYISGWGASYGKPDVVRAGKGLLRVWQQWIFFVSLLALFCLISRYLPYEFGGVDGLYDLVSNYMFKVSFPGFYAVNASIWFIPLFFVVVIFNTIVLMLIGRSGQKEKYSRAFMWLMIAAFLWMSFDAFFPGPANMIYLFYYGAFWMMGYERVFDRISLPRFIVCLIIVAAVFVFAALYDLNVRGIMLYDLQSAKVPPTLKIGSSSMVAILVIRFLEPHVKKPSQFLAHIGRNAIFYFFAQAVSVTIVYLWISHIVSNWFLNYLIALTANIVIAIAIAEALAWLYKSLVNLIGRIKKVHHEA